MKDLNETLATVYVKILFLLHKLELGNITILSYIVILQCHDNRKFQYRNIGSRDATIWVIAILRIDLSVLQYIAVLQYMIKFEKTHHVFKTCF